MTLCLFINSLHRAVISSSVLGRFAGVVDAGGGGGAEVVVARGVVLVEPEFGWPECWDKSDWRRGISAPE